MTHWIINIGCNSSKNAVFILGGEPFFMSVSSVGVLIPQRLRQFRNQFPLVVLGPNRPPPPTHTENLSEAPQVPRPPE